METIAAIALILLVLACPLGMLAIGGVVWVVARARGQKADLSMGCMGGHGEHQQGTAQSGDSALRDQVTQLQAEVASLKAQPPRDESSADRGSAVARPTPDLS